MITDLLQSPRFESSESLFESSYIVSYPRVERPYKVVQVGLLLALLLSERILAVQEVKGQVIVLG